jgi:hypothetical protein
VDLSKCYCDKPGYCETFRRVMGTDPPDWQWCQNSSPGDKQHFYEMCSKQKLPIKRSDKFITVQNLHEVAISLMPYLCQFDGFVGVPRSGMMPASLVSVLLSKPLYSITDGKLNMLRYNSPYGGTRMNNYMDGCEKLAFIDDTTYDGKTAKQLRKTFGENIKIISMFSTTHGSEYVDKFGQTLEAPHLLEWNFFNSAYVRGTMFDIDGIFAPNVPIEICLDEKKYIKWLRDVSPLAHRVPRLFKASLLVTGRLEKYRDITEEWLSRNGLEYENLIMFPDERETERNTNHHEVVGRFKGEIFNASHTHKYFIESEINEAKVIREQLDISDKIIICPNEAMIL